MNRILDIKKSLVLVLCLGILIGVPARISYSAVTSATDATTLNKVTDWFATVGKTRAEKAIILKNRRVARQRARSLKEIERRRKIMAKKRAALLKKLEQQKQQQ